MLRRQPWFYAEWFNAQMCSKAAASVSFGALEGTIKGYHRAENFGVFPNSKHGNAVHYYGMYQRNWPNLYSCSDSQFSQAEEKCTGCTSSAEPRDGFTLNTTSIYSDRFLQNSEAVIPWGIQKTVKEKRSKEHSSRWPRYFIVNNAPIKCRVVIFLYKESKKTDWNEKDIRAITVIHILMGMHV